MSINNVLQSLLMPIRIWLLYLYMLGQIIVVPKGTHIIVDLKICILNMYK